MHNSYANLTHLKKQNRSGHRRNRITISSKNITVEMYSTTLIPACGSEVQETNEILLHLVKFVRLFSTSNAQLASQYNSHSNILGFFLPRLNLVTRREFQKRAYFEDTQVPIDFWGKHVSIGYRMEH